LHEFGRRRRPGVLDVVEFAVQIAHCEVQVAIAVEICEHGDALIAYVDAGEEVRVVALAARWHSWDIIIINIVVIIQIRV